MNKTLSTCVYFTSNMYDILYYKKFNTNLSLTINLIYNVQHAIQMYYL